VYALWRRFLLCFEIRKRLPGSLQSVLGVLLRSSRVSIKDDTVDLEHAVVRLVGGSQILPLLQGDGGFETVGFRTEVDGGLVVTVHAKDSRSAQTAIANIAHDGAVSGESVSERMRAHGLL